jgi:hypothetical protein
MGSSVKGISNEVGRAIDDLRKILKRSSFEKPREKACNHEKQPDTLSSRQLEILKRRFEHNSSFTVIARELQLPEKEVRREFLHAYPYVQKENRSLKPF